MKNTSPISSKLEKRGLTSSLMFSQSTSSLLEKNKTSKQISQKRIEQESFSRRTLDPTFPERPTDIKQGKRKINPAHNNDFWDKSSTSTEFETRSTNKSWITSRDNPLSGQVCDTEESPKKTIRPQKYLESHISWETESQTSDSSHSLQSKISKTASSIDCLPGSFYVMPDNNHKSQKKLNPLKYETTLFNPVVEKPLKRNQCLEQNFEISGRFVANDNRSSRK